MKPLRLDATVRTALMLSACLWLASCALPAGFFKGEDAAPAFRDASMSVQQAASVVVAGKSTRAEVAALLGNATVIHFDSGFEVWLYRVKAPGAAPAATEFVILFGPDGVVRKTRVRPPQGVNGSA